MVSNERVDYIDKDASVEEKRWEILHFLMKNPYSTTYAIGRGVKIAYSQMHGIMRELVFCRLVLSNKKESSNGEIYDHYFIPSKMIFCEQCLKVANSRKGEKN